MRKRAYETAEELIHKNFLSYRTYQLRILGFTGRMVARMKPDVASGTEYSRKYVISFLRAIVEKKIEASRNELLKANGMLQEFSRAISTENN